MLAVALAALRAIMYREQNEINSSDAQMAVVIQKMIFADKSGVTFTILTQSMEMPIKF